MVRSLTIRIVLVALIAALGLGLTLWLDGSRSQAAMTLPAGSTFGAGQHLAYALRPAEGGTSVYVSAGGQSWRPLPGTIPGRATLAAASPAAPAVFYAAGSAGSDAPHLFATLDAGATWQAVALPTEAAITALALDPQVPDLAYAATAGGALFKATDAGQSWRQLPAAALTGARVHQLLINPAHSDIVYVATDRGLFRSTTAGEVWSPATGIGGAIVAVSLSPADPNLLFAAAPEGALFRSGDAGGSWEQVAGAQTLQPGAALAIMALAQDPARPLRVYVAAASEASRRNAETGEDPSGSQCARCGSVEAALSAIYVSDDGGTTWARLAQTDEPAVLLMPVSGDLPAVRATSGGALATYTADPEAAAAALESTDPGVRFEAARLLSVSAGAEESEALLGALDDDNASTGAFVARALGRLPVEAVAPHLVERLERGDDPAEVRLRVILALGEMRAAWAVPALRTVLLSEPILARPAADALARIGSAEAWDALVEALAAREDVTHRAAGAALLLAGEPAMPALRAAAESADPTLSARAVEVLAWSRDLQPPAVSPRLPAVEVAPLAPPEGGLPAWLRLAIVTLTAGLAVVLLAGLPAPHRRAHSQA